MEAAAVPRPPAVRSAASMMRRRNFALFFSGRCISFLGNAMAPVALAFAVLQISGSASALGIVLAARMVPNVLFLLVGGVIADRLPRSTVLVGTNVIGGVAQAVVAVLLLSGRAEVWQLVVLEAVNGTAFALFYPGGHRRRAARLCPKTRCSRRTPSSGWARMRR